MKKLSMLCCLLALLTTMAFAAGQKKVDQSAIKTDLAQARHAVELNLQLKELDLQIGASKRQGKDPVDLQSQRQEIMKQLGRSNPEHGRLDECPDASVTAPAVYQGNLCESGNDCADLLSEDFIVAVTIPYSGAWRFSYEGFDYDPYLLLGYECCTYDICSDDDGGEGLNSLCDCIYLNEGTVVYATLEAYSGCGGFVLTVSESTCGLGRCCYTSDFAGPTCANTTLDDCNFLSGVWSEGLDCEQDPCVRARCCYFIQGDAACTMATEAECLYQLGGEWSEGFTCEDACPAPGNCGPIDLVFAVDVTGSMIDAITNVVAEMPNIIAVASAASGNDLRLGLVTFSDEVYTLHSLTTDIAAVQATIAGLTSGGGNNLPEASDEALREIITQDGQCVVTDFTTAFRPAATKLIVLITDASNGGCDDIHDASDDINAHQRALDAFAAGVRISSVFIPNPYGEGAAFVVPILTDYATTSGGSLRIAAANGAGTGGAVNGIVADCGQGGDLRLNSIPPTLRCDPNGGGITTPTFDVEVTVTNAGNALCGNAVLTLSSIGGDAGSAVLNSANPVNIGNLAPNASANGLFNITITPDNDGGTLLLTFNVSSENCPPNFIQVAIEVPDCSPCDGETEIYLFEDDLRIPPACMCSYLCPGAPVDIYVCGDGFTPRRYPILTITPGCHTEECNEDCRPAEFLFSNTGWTLWEDGCWHNLIIPQSEGCICICFERFLPVELGSFAAIARDGEIQLNWNTASETENDHFELQRDGLMMAQVAATNNATGSSYTYVDRGLTNGRSYHYELVSVSVNGERAVAGELNAVPQAGSAVVTELSLHQNYPNPFNPETNITFDLVETGMVTLKVYNAVGQEVAALVNGTMNEGRHTVEFKATGLPSGLYFYRLTAGESTMQKKMLLLK